MNQYINAVNSGVFYAIVALVLTFITIMCIVFLVKSYKAGLQIGMDEKVLKKTILSSATFTFALPDFAMVTIGSGRTAISTVPAFTASRRASGFAYLVESIVTFPSRPFS